MIILFRAESSPIVGLGHLIRSLFIANTIRNTYPNTEIIFLTGDDASSISKIQENKFEFIISSAKNEEFFLLSNCINKNVDVLFIDKLYNYSTDFILQLSKYCKVTMFHNLCEGAHLCDAFILPAIHIHPQILNDPKWTNGRVKFYEGIKYIVLNDKIINLSKSKSAKTNVKIIVITTGGSDPTGVMLKILGWINKLEIQDIIVYALIGESFVHNNKLKLLKKELKSYILIKPYNVSYFEIADIAISTFGVSTYELMFLGLPIMSIGHREQNAKGSKILSEKYDQLIDLGNIDNLSMEEFNNTLLKTMKKLKKIRVADCYIDGKGVNRVAEIIYKLGKEV
ncbi:hypothetical protein ACFLSY_00980 [Bacteroidota bacterium]